jgi:hypothetical protein
MGAFLTAALYAVLATSGVWSIAHSIRAGRTRRGLQRLQQYANHPASRPILDDFHKPRKETP